MTEFADIIRRELKGPVAVGAEIGVSCGKSSASILRAFPDLHLYMVDAWATYPPQHPYHQSGDGHAQLTQEQQDEHKAKALAATEFAADRRTVLHTTSMEGGWEVEDGSLDFCILDDDHTFGGVMAGLHNWASKLRPGGLFMGHDFSHPRNRKGLFGVDKAVRQYAAKFGRVLRSEGDVWWFEPEKPSAAPIVHTQAEIQQGATMPDWTTVLAVDYEQFARLRLVAPTWAKNRQEIYRHPLLCFCAYPKESPGWWKRQITIVTGHPDIRVIGWPEFEGVSQRHRMLAAFTWGVAAYCETPWHFKLDLDCCVMPNEAEWPPAEWFNDENNYAFIAPKWGYTKPAQMYLDLCEWGKGAKAFDGTEEAPGRWSDPLGKCKHGRIISYAMFGRTEFAKELASLANPPGPVPSQDTFWWYVAERLGRPYLRVTNVGEYGFAHKSRGLAKRCQVAMEENQNALTAPTT